MIVIHFSRGRPALGYEWLDGWKEAKGGPLSVEWQYISLVTCRPASTALLIPTHYPPGSWPRWTDAMSAAFLACKLFENGTLACLPNIVWIAWLMSVTIDEKRKLPTNYQIISLSMASLFLHTGLVEQSLGHDKAYWSADQNINWSWGFSYADKSCHASVFFVWMFVRR